MHPRTESCTCCIAGLIADIVCKPCVSLFDVWRSAARASGTGGSRIHQGIRHIGIVGTCWGHTRALNTEHKQDLCWMTDVSLWCRVSSCLRQISVCRLSTHVFPRSDFVSMNFPVQCNTCTCQRCGDEHLPEKSRAKGEQDSCLHTYILLHSSQLRCFKQRFIAKYHQ